MREVVFLEEAKVEFAEAVDYYEKIYSGLGLDLENEVKALIVKISNYPEIWALREDGTRRCSTKRFPYQIVCFLYDGVVWILAVAHHKRFPEYWKERLDSEQINSPDA